MKIIKNWLNREKNPGSDNESTREISRRIVLVQRKTADYLNSKTASWTTRQLKVRLICFCVVAGGYSVFIAIHAVNRSNGPPKNVHAKPLHNNGSQQHNGAVPFPDK